MLRLVLFGVAFFVFEASGFANGTLVNQLVFNQYSLAYHEHLPAALKSDENGWVTGIGLISRLVQDDSLFVPMMQVELGSSDMTYDGTFQNGSPTTFKRQSIIGEAKLIFDRRFPALVGTPTLSIGGGYLFWNRPLSYSEQYHFTYLTTGLSLQCIQNPGFSLGLSVETKFPISGSLLADFKDQGATRPFDISHYSGLTIAIPVQFTMFSRNFEMKAWHEVFSVQASQVQRIFFADGTFGNAAEPASVTQKFGLTLFTAI